MAMTGCRHSASVPIMPRRIWRGLIRQLIALGALDVDTAGHGGLFLVQDKARPILRGETRVMLREEGRRRTEVRRPERHTVAQPLPARKGRACSRRCVPGAPRRRRRSAFRPM